MTKQLFDSVECSLERVPILPISLRKLQHVPILIPIQLDSIPSFSIPIRLVATSVAFVAPVTCQVAIGGQWCIGGKPSSNSPSSSPMVQSLIGSLFICLFCFVCMSNQREEMAMEVQMEGGREVEEGGGVSRGKGEKCAALEGNGGPQKKTKFVVEHFLMSPEYEVWMALLSMGDRIDCLDIKFKWYPSYIIDIELEPLSFHVHYEGWNSKWDEWVSASSKRIAPLGTHIYDILSRNEIKERPFSNSEWTLFIQSNLSPVTFSC